MANWENIESRMKYFLISFLLMETLLIAVFVVLDLMLFYIFFESVLIPMFLVVGIWGGSDSRIRASFLLFLYTLGGSLFMLLSFMVIYYNVGSTDYAVVLLSEFNLSGQQILWLGIFLSFAVKTPLFPFYDSSLERALDQHSTNPVLEPTHNPTLLARTASLSADISYLLQVPSSAWKSHPIHKALTSNPPEPLVAYIARLTELAANRGEVAGLLAHSYVRYLGDLSGGQTIRHTLEKAYSLDEGSGEGLEFYTFNEMAGQKIAGGGEIKRIKDWFREGMNRGAGNNLRVKGSFYISS